jgi:hypothetical protein
VKASPESGAFERGRSGGQQVCKPLVREVAAVLPLSVQENRGKEGRGERPKLRGLEAGRRVVKRHPPGVFYSFTGRDGRKGPQAGNKKLRAYFIALQRGTRDTINSMGAERRRSQGQTQTNASHTKHTHIREGQNPPMQGSQGDCATGNRGQPQTNFSRGTRKAVQRGPAGHPSEGIQAGAAQRRVFYRAVSPGPWLRLLRPVSRPVCGFWVFGSASLSDA